MNRLHSPQYMSQTLKNAFVSNNRPCSRSLKAYGGRYQLLSAEMTLCTWTQMNCTYSKWPNCAELSTSHMLSFVFHSESCNKILCHAFVYRDDKLYEYATYIGYRRLNERNERLYIYFILQACTWIHYCCKSPWTIFQLLYIFLPGKNTCLLLYFKFGKNPFRQTIFKKSLLISFTRFMFNFLVPSIRKVLLHSKIYFVDARSLNKRPI